MRLIDLIAAGRHPVIVLRLDGLNMVIHDGRPESIRRVVDLLAGDARAGRDRAHDDDGGELWSV